MRPLPITILCVILFFVIAISAALYLYSLAFFFDEMLSVIPIERMILDGINFAAAATAAVGLWKMRRWAVYLHIVIFTALMTDILFFKSEEIAGNPTTMSVGMLIYCIVVFPYWRRLK